MTLPSYDEANARAQPRPPFVNGTEGYGWLESNCSSCVHDAPARREEWDKGCPLILVALLGRTPAEWLSGPRDEYGRYGIADQYHCVMYRPEDGPGDGEPAPIPDPPGQLTLCPRAGLQRPGRMLAGTRPVEVDA